MELNLENASGILIDTSPSHFNVCATSNKCSACVCDLEVQPLLIGTTSTNCGGLQIMEIVFYMIVSCMYIVTVKSF